MHKIQVNITDEANSILSKLNQKNTKSLFVDLAIKHFENTKEAKLFLINETDKNKSLSNKKNKD